MMRYKTKDIPLAFDRTNAPTVEQQGPQWGKEQK